MSGSMREREYMAEWMCPSPMPGRTYVPPRSVRSVPGGAMSRSARYSPTATIRSSEVRIASGCGMSWECHWPCGVQPVAGFMAWTVALWNRRCMGLLVVRRGDGGAVASDRQAPPYDDAAPDPRGAVRRRCGDSYMSGSSFAGSATTCTTAGIRSSVTARTASATTPSMSSLRSRRAPKAP